MATATKRERLRCYFCKRFISFEESLMNWKHIQNPHTYDPDAYEIIWCDACEKDGSTY